MRLRIASRQSDLARIQAHEVAKALKESDPSIEVEFHFSESLGDKNLTDPLWKMPGKGVFTEDLTGDLVAGKADLVVHSWKDLPVEEKEETEIVATLPRADVRDLLLFKKASRAKLSTGAGVTIFSSSPRREYNLKPFLSEFLPGSRAPVEFTSVRGNIPTRLRKLLEAVEVDGLVVAKAAIDRLLATTADEFSAGRESVKQALKECDYMVLPLSRNPAAPAQGALAIEIRRDRSDLREVLKKIHHQKTFVEARAEREILKFHGGGCHQKIGCTVLARDLEKPAGLGRLSFLKGLTEKGEVLQKRSLESSVSGEPQVLRSQWLFERKPGDFGGIPTGIDALFVSQVAAWPSGLSWGGILWTAGLSTWKKMAEQGHWVHGTSESLGETEDPRLERVSGSLSWGTLTHSLAKKSSRGTKIATYDLVLRKEVSAPPVEESLYWSSGILFDEAVKRWPELKNRKHFCGPGKTYEHLRGQIQNVSVRWPMNEEG